MSCKLNDTRRWNKIILFLLLLSLLAITACDSTGQKESGPSNRPISWTQSDMDTLMKQVADHELEKRYSRYLPDELVAAAEVYGLDWDGDQGTAYTSILACEFVLVKGKAYLMASTGGETIIRFNFDGQYPKLEKLEWSKNGMEHDKWLEENFPPEYLEKYKEYRQQEIIVEDEVEKKIKKEVKELMDASIETDNLLEIDLDQETYEIVRIVEGYDENGEYKFDFETVEKGKLKELSKVTQLDK